MKITNQKNRFVKGNGEVIIPKDVFDMNWNYDNTFLSVEKKVKETYYLSLDEVYLNGEFIGIVKLCNMSKSVAFKVSPKNSGRVFMWEKISDKVIKIELI